MVFTQFAMSQVAQTAAYTLTLLHRTQEKWTISLVKKQLMLVGNINKICRFKNIYLCIDFKKGVDIYV